MHPTNMKEKVKEEKKLNTLIFNNHMSSHTKEKENNKQT